MPTVGAHGVRPARLTAAPARYRIPSLVTVVTPLRQWAILSAVIKPLTAACLWLCLASVAGAQDTLGLFHSDPIQFFAGNSGRTWIGRGTFMMTDFSDTVIVTTDSTRHSLQVRRVLVNEDDTVVVSRGRGYVGFATGDTTIPLRWTESRYPQVTGRMRFAEGQWVLEFDGEWKQWSIRLARQNDNAFAASVGRALGTLPPIMFTGLTYQALPVKPKAARH